MNATDISYTLPTLITPLTFPSPHPLERPDWTQRSPVSDVAQETDYPDIATVLSTYEPSVLSVESGPSSRPSPGLDVDAILERRSRVIKDNSRVRSQDNGKDRHNGKGQNCGEGVSRDKVMASNTEKAAFFTLKERPVSTATEDDAGSTRPQSKVKSKGSGLNIVTSSNNARTLAPEPVDAALLSPLSVYSPARTPSPNPVPAWSSNDIKAPASPNDILLSYGFDAEAHNTSEGVKAARAAQLNQATQTSPSNYLPPPGPATRGPTPVSADRMITFPRVFSPAPSRSDTGGPSAEEKIMKIALDANRAHEAAGRRFFRDDDGETIATSIEHRRNRGEKEELRPVVQRNDSQASQDSQDSMAVVSRLIKKRAESVCSRLFTLSYSIDSHQSPKKAPSISSTEGSVAYTHSDSGHSEASTGIATNAMAAR